MPPCRTIVALVLAVLASAGASADPPRVIADGLRYTLVDADLIAGALDPSGPRDIERWALVTKAHEQYVDGILALAPAMDAFSERYHAQFWINYPPIKADPARRERDALERRLDQLETALVDAIADIGEDWRVPARSIGWWQRRRWHGYLAGHRTRFYVDVRQMLDRMDLDPADRRRAEPILLDAEARLDPILRAMIVAHARQNDAFMAGLRAAGLDEPPYDESTWSDADRAATAEVWHAASADRSRGALEAGRVLRALVDDLAAALPTHATAIRRRYLIAAYAPYQRDSVAVERRMKVAARLRGNPTRKDAITELRTRWLDDDLAALDRLAAAAERAASVPWYYHHTLPPPDPAAFARSRERTESRESLARTFDERLTAALDADEAAAIASPVDHRERFSSGPTSRPAPPPPWDARIDAFIGASPEYVFDIDKTIGWPAPPMLESDDWQRIARGLGRPADDPVLDTLRDDYESAWESLRAVIGNVPMSAWGFSRDDGYVHDAKKAAERERALATIWPTVADAESTVLEGVEALVMNDEQAVRIALIRRERELDLYGRTRTLGSPLRRLDCRVDLNPLGALRATGIDDEQAAAIAAALAPALRDLVELRRARMERLVPRVLDFRAAQDAVLWSRGDARGRYIQTLQAAVAAIEQVEGTDVDAVSHAADAVVAGIIGQLEAYDGAQYRMAALRASIGLQGRDVPDVARRLWPRLSALGPDHACTEPLLAVASAYEERERGAIVAMIEASATHEPIVAGYSETDGAWEQRSRAIILRIHQQSRHAAVRFLAAE